MSATLAAGLDVLCEELLGQFSNSVDIYAQCQDSPALNDAAADNAHEAGKTPCQRAMSSEHYGIGDKEGPDSSFA